MNPPVSGVCPVISAAFHSDGSIDLDGFRSIAEMVIGAGVPSVMVFGVATENSKLTDPERDQMLAALVEVRDRAPTKIVATIADHSTEVAMRRLGRWVEMGADVINILPSRFLDPPVDQARYHLETLLSGSAQPVVIQYLPQAGTALSLEEIVALSADFTSFQQVKVEEIPASPAIRKVAQISGGRLTSLVGWGGLEWIEATEAGSVGVQPGCSVPELYLYAQGFLDRGDVQGFQNAFAPLRQPLATWLRHVEVLIAMEKFILMRRGIISADRCRRPSAAITRQDLELADGVLSALEVLNTT